MKRLEDRCHLREGGGSAARAVRGVARAGRGGGLIVAGAPGRSGAKVPLAAPVATGGWRSLSLVRGPFAAVDCVASLSLVREPPRATRSVHRAPPAPPSASGGLGRGSVGRIRSAVVAGGAGDLQKR